MLPLLEISPDLIYPGFFLPIKEMVKKNELNLKNQNIWEYQEKIEEPL